MNLGGGSHSDEISFGTVTRGSGFISFPIGLTLITNGAVEIGMSKCRGQIINLLKYYEPIFC